MFRGGNGMVETDHSMRSVNEGCMCKGAPVLNGVYDRILVR